MLQIYMNRTVYIGLTAVNLDRLQRSMPIRFPLAVGADTVVLVYGHNKLRILDQLAEAGIEIPNAVREAVTLDPL